MERNSQGGDFVLETGAIKATITNYWNNTGQNYDKSFGHGMRSDEEKKAWLAALKDLVGQNVCAFWMSALALDSFVIVG